MSVPANVERAAKALVAHLMQNVRDARGAVVATEDGFEVASQVSSSAQVGRLAAMASSIAALGAVAGDESELGQSKSLVIEAARGYIVMGQARRTDIDLIVSVITGPDAVLGQLLLELREGIKALGDA